MKQKMKNEGTQVTKVSEPKTDDKTPENIEPVVTEAVEAQEPHKPRRTQTSQKLKKPRYEHRETSKIVTKDAVPRESLEIVAEEKYRYFTSHSCGSNRRH